MKSWTVASAAVFTATLAPLTEVPFNIAQALIGLLVTVPLVRSIKHITRGREFSLRGNEPPTGKVRQ